MKNTLHLVSHTHWDREWYLTYQQFRLKLVNLIDGLLELLENDDQYKYFMLDGQTIVLEDYLEIRPEKEEKLKELIRSGRLIIGPWYILPDEFLVSPESTIRNLLLGDQICRDFGGKMKIGYIPDPFGHISQMPQILNGFGIHSAIFRRGLSDEPVELRWESPDGSSVFVSYLRDGYDNAAGLPTHDQNLFSKEVRRLRDSLKQHSVSNQILLMQGTDHMSPPADTTSAIASTKGKLDGDILVHSTLERYLAAVQTSIKGFEIPLVHGELRSPKKHHLLPGVLSTRMWIKQQNNLCETLLEKWVEPFSTFNQLSDEIHDSRFNQKPSGFIDRSWRILLQNHPHDSICGCSIDQVHDEMNIRFDQVEQIGEEITMESLIKISNKINTHRKSEGDISCLIVFNPNSFKRTDIVNCDLSLPSDVHSFKLVDTKGNQIPFQILGSNSSELINMKLDKDGLAGIIGSIHDGRIGNLAIQTIKFDREDGSTINIIAELDEFKPPNLAEWDQAIKSINQLLTDPSIKFLHIQAFNSTKMRISFSISEVPPLGWKTIYVQQDPKETITQGNVNLITRMLSPLLIKIFNTKTGQKLIELFSTKESKPPYKIENEFFVVELDRSGTLNIFDKKNAKQYKNLNLFKDGGDAGDEYNYCPPENDILINAKLVKKKVYRENINEVLETELVIKAPSELNSDRKSRKKDKKTISIISKAQLAVGVPRIDINARIVNTVKDHRIRVHFPLIDNAESLQPFKASHDGHFDVINRSIGIPEFDSSWVEDPRPEVPQRAFSDISTKKNGLMLANRGLPEVEIHSGKDKHELILTLIRSVGWLSRDDFPNRKGHAGPFLPTPKAQMVGEWNFEYSIIPHSGSWKTNQEYGTPYQQALGFNSPLRAIETSIHKAQLPSTGSFISVSPDEFIISSIKQAKDHDKWILRGYNLSDNELEVTIKFWKPFSSVTTANLLEEPSDRLLPGKDGYYSIPVLPHQILTLSISNG